MPAFIKKIKAVRTELLLSVLTGVILLLSLPGYNLFPLAFLGFALLFYSIERGKLSAKIITFIAGFIFYTMGLTWIGVPMTLFGGAPVYAGAALVFAAGLVGGLFFWLPFGWVIDKTRSLVLSGLVFIALEMVKSSFLFGGLPWLNIGQTQYNNIYALQIVSVAGEYGLSFLVILTGGFLYKSLKYRDKKSIALLSGLIVLTFGFGFLRLAVSRPPEPAYTARIVQTGVKQEDKWNSAKRGDVLTALRRDVSSAVFADGDYDLLVLPETAFPANPFSTPAIKDIITGGSADHPIILGFERYLLNGSERKLFNSAVMVSDGRISELYDKMKLAPFGEYFPLESLLKPIKRYFFGNSPGFTAGVKYVVFEHKGLKVAPLICYEGAFSPIISGNIKNGANLLTVISNDSWFGQSIGRVQNFAINSVRAAEYKRYILRSTQDGISGMISPYGEALALLPEKQFTYMDMKFSPIADITLFAKFGYLWYALVLVFYAFWYIIYKRKKVLLTVSGGKKL
jgi:apolipoprotein N-acyltransferase